MQLPTPPCSFATFEIVAVLGSGGFATVFRAIDTGSHREVALKILHPDTSDGYLPETMARFRRELRALGQLTSPHTVLMYEWGEHDGLLYIVFELLAGRDLGELLSERGTLDEPMVVHIMRQVLLSLDEAHSKGLLHRDIKPDNIIAIESDGPPHIKLLDFGIARASDSSHPSITKTGQLVGTPHYMAPEHMLDRDVTARSDLYSLGIVGMEMLLGRSALHGFSWSDQLERLQSGYVFSVPQLEQISPGLRRILSRMTATKPEDRITDARSVLAMLDGGRVTSHVVTTQAPQRTSLMLLAGLVVALGIALAVFVSLLEEPPQPVERRPVPVELTTSLPVSPSSPDAARDMGADVEVGDSRCPASPFVGRGMLSQDRGLGRRRWDAYLPARAEEKMPLVVLLPRADSSAHAFLDVSGFEALAEKHGFAVIAVRTDGPGEVWPFVAATMDQVCIDASRVYVAGQGHGGRTALELSCQPWLAGAAVYAMRLKEGERLCAGRPIPLLQFMSTKSPMDPAEGGTGSCPLTLIPKVSIARMEKMLVAQHRCRERVPALDQEGCQTWKTCEDAPLVSCHLDGGQPWPGQDPRYTCDGRAPDFPVAEVVWRFFEPLTSDAESSDEPD